MPKDGQNELKRIIGNQANRYNKRVINGISEIVSSQLIHRRYQRNLQKQTNKHHKPKKIPNKEKLRSKNQFLKVSKSAKTGSIFSVFKQRRNIILSIILRPLCLYTGYLEKQVLSIPGICTRVQQPEQNLEASIQYHNILILLLHIQLLSVFSQLVSQKLLSRGNKSLHLNIGDIFVLYQYNTSLPSSDVLTFSICKRNRFLKSILHITPTTVFIYYLQ
ncbi:Hypothetical_protein [Hexamita inflata]|uniref:Hypothetical_protein n=1 Tax=Hexamita inflata TaxID=28002 RepID=A0AA86NXR2_9EUKA|nr:Hypothetical protein HINF_LOCUS15715 [Hexamita inflata]